MVNSYSKFPLTTLGFKSSLQNILIIAQSNLLDSLKLDHPNEPSNTHQLETLRFVTRISKLLSFNFDFLITNYLCYRKDISCSCDDDLACNNVLEQFDLQIAQLHYSFSLSQMDCVYGFDTVSIIHHSSFRAQMNAQGNNLPQLNDPDLEYPLFSPEEAVQTLEHLLSTDPDFCKDILTGKIMCPESLILGSLPKKCYLFGAQEEEEHLSYILHSSVFRRALLFPNFTFIDDSPLSHSTHQLLYDLSYYPLANTHLVIGPTPFSRLLEDEGYSAQGFFDSTPFELKVNLTDFDQIMTRLEDTVKQKIDDAHKAAHIVRMCTTLILAYRCKDDPFALSLHFLSFLTSLDLSLHLAHKAWAFLEPHILKLFQFKAQATYEYITSLITPIITTLCVVLSLLISSVLPDQKKIDFCLRRMSDFGRCIQGTEKTFDWMNKLITKGIDVVYDKFFGIPKGTMEMEKYISDIGTFFEDIRELTIRETVDGFVHDDASCNKVEYLYRQGLEYSEHLSKLHLTVSEKTPFLFHFNALQKLHQKVLSQGRRNFGPRTEPAIIHIHGESGVGKSAMVFLLAQDLLHTEGLHEDPLPNIYNRNIEQDFWDGYYGQRICIYDDFGQARDSAATPNKEFMEIIRTGNITAWMLHMASLEEKSRTQFKSRALILTSNAVNYSVESLTHVEAFTRRRHIVAKLVNNPQYSSKNSFGTIALDLEKTKDLPDFSTEVYQFQMYDRFTNVGETTTIGGSRRPLLISYDEFAQKCKDIYKDQYEDSLTRIEALKQRGLRMSAQSAETMMDVEAFILSMLWLEKVEKGIEVIDFSSYGIGTPRQDRLRKLANEHETYEDFYIAAVEEISEIEVAYPVVSKLTQIFLRWQTYLLEFVFGVKQRTHEFWQKHCQERFEDAKETIEYVPTSISNMKKKFARTYRRKVKEYQKQPLAIQAFTLNQTLMTVLLGISVLSTGYSFISKMMKPKEIPDKKEEFKTEALRGACGIKDIVLTYQDVELDVEDAYIINSGLCFVFCKECSNFRNVTNSMPCYDATNEQSIINCAYKVLELYTRYHSSSPQYSAEKVNDILSEAKDYVPERLSSEDPPTKTKKGYRTERLSSEDPPTKAKKSYRTERLGSDDPPTRGKKHYRTEQLQQRLTTQAFRDKGQQELIENKLTTNLYKLYTTTDGIDKPLVNILFIQGRCALVPNHAVSFIKNSPRIRIRNVYHNTGYEMETHDLEFHQVTTTSDDPKDACVIYFPSVESKKTILHHFVSTKDLSTFTSARGTLLTITAIGSNLATHCLDVHAKSQDHRRDYGYTDENGKEVSLFVRKHYEYSAGTRPGDCGGPVVVSEQSFQRKILGIHIAGKEQRGIASSITCEDLKTTLKKIKLEAHISLDFDDDVDQTILLSPDQLPLGDFSPHGKLSRTYRTPPKTDLRQSPISGLVTTPITTPSILKMKMVDGVLTDPMKKGLMKCGTPSTFIPQKEIDSATAGYKCKLFANTKSSLQRVFTHEEAISGILGEEYVCAINRRSSPGYPYINRLEGTCGKQKWLGNYNYIYDNAEVLTAIAKRKSFALDNKRVPTLWIDTLKDERVTLSKAEIAKTRVFAAGNMDYVLMFRQYFLGFNAHIMENMIKNEIAVGINPYSYKWNELGNYLGQKGSALVAGDFSNFDGTLNHQILRTICNLINDWYDDGSENAQIRRVLWEEIVSSTHIYGDCVYSWTHSQPSGNPCTVIINSLYNSISLRILWNRIMVNTMYAGSLSFDHHVNLISFGDDNVINIAMSVIEKFNQQTITEAFSTIGMKYTNEDKTESTVPYRTIDQVSFLKRTFRRCSETGLYIAPWNIDSLLESINWVRKDASQEESSIAIIQIAFMELALHGEETFDKWSKLIYSACRKSMQELPALLTYYDYKNMDYNNMF